jgi:hypothetical protein
VSEDVEDFVVLPDISIMVGHRRHESSEASSAVIALVFASVSVEPTTSYQAARVSMPTM